MSRWNLVFVIGQSQNNILNVCGVLFVVTEEEVCPLWGSWSCASDDQQLRGKHPTRCAGFQLLSREFNRTPAKRCCATTRTPIPVNAKGKPEPSQGGYLEVKLSRVITLYVFTMSSQDVIGCTQEMDFILWPRNDIEKIVCLLFSRWKGADDEPFRPVQVRTWHFVRLPRCLLWFDSYVTVVLNEVVLLN